MTIGIFLLRRFTAVQVVSMGFVSAIACSILFLLMPQPIVAALLFASLGLIQGASFASVPQLNKTVPDQALANGTMAQAGNIGNLCGTPLLLMILSAGGTQAMIALVVACYITGIILHVVFAKRRAFDQLLKTTQ